MPFSVCVERTVPLTEIVQLSRPDSDACPAIAVRVNVGNAPVTTARRDHGNV